MPPPPVVGFQEALDASHGQPRSLLIGNGFSAAYFQYASLLAASGIEPGTPLHNLFGSLNTADFELVIRALEDAAIVELAYGNDAHADELKAHAQEAREALIQAVKATHPEHRADLAHLYESSAAFLANFETVFSLNYDLLLYWSNLEALNLTDGFGLAEVLAGGRLRSPFREDAYCSLFNLHGGLHLFESDDELMKAIDTGDGVVETVARIIRDGRLPLYVAEGTSSQKERKVNAVPYLRHCFAKLWETPDVLFVYGHSAAENDAHVYRGVFGANRPHVYFGVYQPTEQKLTALDGELARYQHLGGMNVPYSFYDAESAHVWDA